MLKGAVNLSTNQPSFGIIGGFLVQYKFLEAELLLLSPCQHCCQALKGNESTGCNQGNSLMASFLFDTDYMSLCLRRLSYASVYLYLSANGKTNS